ncbi:MAG TPA: hypothetical protein VFG38_09830 [Pseudomonadales bacterium]|nr:hypothetical protein [Pseudomonadales bacterium]
MTTFVLDLNDSELRLARIGADTSEVVAQSSGFALIEDRSIVFGDAALKQYRLHPRKINNHYWNRLNSEPLPARGRNAANNADLVYGHFAELLRTAGFAKGDECFIATPGTTTNEQLGLLLGIAAEAGAPVTGLVDAGLAACVAHPAPKRIVHIDVSLHRAVVTELTKAEGLARQRADEIGELGLTSLLDAWVNVIADRFVREARFDPLSIAATDQQVYDRLVDWLMDPARQREFGIDVDHRGSLRRAELSTDALVAKVAPRYRALDRFADGSTVFLSHRAARLPGLTEQLAATATRVVALERMDLFRGIVAHQGLIRSDPNALRLVTRLPVAPVVPVEREREPTPAAPLRLAPERPTHVLYGSDAVAIGQSLTIGRDGFPELPDDFPHDAVQIVATGNGVQLRLKESVFVTLDGDAVNGSTALVKGAVLDVGGLRFQLIRTRSGP